MMSQSHSSHHRNTNSFQNNNKSHNNSTSTTTTSTPLKKPNHVFQTTQQINSSNDSINTPYHRRQHSLNSKIGQQGQQGQSSGMKVPSLQGHAQQHHYQQSQSPYMNQLDYFTNNYFSRSFNSLILDDSNNELTNHQHQQNNLKKRLNKSPPFNVKQDLFNDTIDNCLEESDNDVNCTINDESDDMDDDDDQLLDYMSQLTPNLIKKSSHNDRNQFKTTLNDEDFSNSTLKLSSTTINNQNTQHSNSQSSIKRSSKFLNLSIDSNLRSVDSKLPRDEMDKINLNEIDIKVNSTDYSSSSQSSSPILLKQQQFQPSSAIKTSLTNQFKRPHKLISQSPSPSSNKIISSSSPQSNLYSPSKLGLKGFKMFKNSNKDAIISPSRVSSTLNTNSTPEKPTLKSTIFGFQTNKLRKTLTPNHQSHKSTSTPIPTKKSKYVEESEFDSPSKNRKSSNSTSHSNSIIIYHDEMNHSQQQQKNNPGSKCFYDEDKENKNSYQFVKPLQTVFNSAGLMKKNSIAGNHERNLPPETPIKRNPLMMVNQNKNLNLRNYEPTTSTHGSMSDFESSIEVGRNLSYDSSSNHHSSLNNNSYFKPTSTVKSNKTNIYNSNQELGMLLSSDIEIDNDVILETPTKKHNSTTHPHPQPTHPQPSQKRNNQHHLKINIHQSGLVEEEPSTPINLLFDKSNEAPNAQFLTMPSLDEVSTDIPLSSTTSLYPNKIDEHLINKFGMQNIKYIGKGEFSIAYECLFNSEKFAIKRSKKPIIGKMDRKNINREIEALRTLTSIKDNDCENLKEQEEGKEYLVYFIEAWDFNNYFYIMTEFCEGGTLFEFLESNKNYKIDEFRIWKILIEILNGLRFIHHRNYLHLDLKPANIFITFEGQLKIGDFGLATKLPILESDFDIEGDRNYIAPELINDKIYTPFADIFSLGLIILEIAANIILPDNGTPWRKLRSGDLSDAGQLSSDNISMFLQHKQPLRPPTTTTTITTITSSAGGDGDRNNVLSNSSNNLMTQFSSSTTSHSLSLLNPPNTTTSLQPMSKLSQQEKNPTGIDMNLNYSIPKWAPDFLINGDSMVLDRLVNKMLRPNPFDRPNANSILEMNECVIIENRRKCGATIFEGEFGSPPDE